MATKDGRRIAFEIETGKSDVEGNLGKLPSCGVDRVVVVATSEATAGDLSSTLKLSPTARVITAGQALKRTASW